MDVIMALFLLRLINDLLKLIFLDTISAIHYYFQLCCLFIKMRNAFISSYTKSVRQYVRISIKWSCIIIIMEKTYTIKISISEMEIIPQSHNGVLLFSSFMSPDYPLSFLSLFSCPAMFAIFHWKMILIYSGWNKDTNYCCSPFYKQLFHYNQVFVVFMCR